MLVDGDNGIIAGHGRVLAARQLGLDAVPVIELSHLTQVQRQAYVLADNKLSLNAGWDESLLALELTDLHGSGFDIALTGFSQDEVNNLNLSFDPAEEADQGRLDELAPKYVSCPHCGKEFDTRA